MTFGIYRHYKGVLYVALGTGQNSTNSANNERMVIYFSFSKRKLCIRKETEFHEVVAWPNGKPRARFEKVFP